MKFYPPETERIVCMNNCVGSSGCVPGGPVLGVLWRLAWFEPLYGTCQWTVKDYTGPLVCFNCCKKRRNTSNRWRNNIRVGEDRVVWTPTPGIQPPYPRPIFPSLPRPLFFLIFFWVPPQIQIFCPPPPPIWPPPPAHFSSKDPLTPPPPNPRALCPPPHKNV